ncbi:family 78 glycoside hydrolase catalytic domain [Paenibacillus yanchengensis]|uniref:alpha-L-rhamnosidase n=1 Tax=Paenibacillus yanchengensis TaxID=2035833 RepID=A0ABW4YLH2_9BACL
MSVQVVDLKVEYATNPLGLTTLEPRFFWKSKSSKSNKLQSAYQIQVASDRQLLLDQMVDIWDTAKVNSDESLQITYQGKQLEAEKHYYWRVRIWDEEGIVSEWSEIAYWSMGILERSQWKAKWIGRKPEAHVTKETTSLEIPPAYMRKEFVATKQVKRAMVYASALGLYELSFNGNVISPLFAPGWTDYHKRVQIQAYDVTNVIKQGAQVFSVILGNGWYAGTVGFLGDRVYGARPLFSMQAKIEYTDGTVEEIRTDETWKVTKGPLLYSDMIMGETYDATLELIGYQEAGYDDKEWEVPDTRPGYNALLTGTIEPPIIVAEQLKPISIQKTKDNTYIYDMGQNMVGWVKVAVQGAKGTKITVSHAEMLNPDGSLYLENLRKAVQQDHYILKGIGTEYYEPKFTFHGFRYVELIGYPGEADLDTIIGQVIHSDIPKTGNITTSNAMINQLFSNIDWGQRGNFLSVPTDCPQRDERMGWTGDAQIFARTATYNRDVAKFFDKFYIDMLDCQQPSGAFTDVAPDAGWIRHKMWNTRLNWHAPDNPGWGDAGVIIPWTMYLMYGDKQVLESNYDASVRWIQYLHDMSDNLIRPDYANYEDWLSIGSTTPKELIATAYFAYSTQLVAKIAEIIGKPDDAAYYNQLFVDITKAYQQKFVDEQGKIYGHTQTGYVLSLSFGLLTPEQQKQAVQYLVEDITERGNKLSTGFMGVAYVLPVLSDYAQDDLAYKLLVQEQFPSWLYSVNHGATTIWERWDGWTEHNGFQTPSMNSFNHYAYGSVGEWMYRYMAGMETDEQQSAFKHIHIKPRLDRTLAFVEASYESLYGLIRSNWKITGDQYELTVEIPANTTATVHLPIDGKLGEYELHNLGSGTATFIGKLV